MPVLLLCYGDKEAKELLKAAIEARYGATPPVIDSLVISFKGRARAKLGPITTWVPVDAKAYFRFPTRIRWDFTVRPLGLTVQRGVESFDGESYISARGSNPPTVITNDQYAISVRRRLWAIAATLLTPLSDSAVKLTNAASHCFEATHTKLNDSVLICTRSNKTVEYTSVFCLNPDTEKEQKFTLAISEEQRLAGDLMLPAQISAHWDDEISFEMTPSSAQINPILDDTIFTLESDMN